MKDKSSAATKFVATHHIKNKPHFEVRVISDDGTTVRFDRGTGTGAVTEVDASYFNDKYEPIVYQFAAPVTRPPERETLVPADLLGITDA